MQIDINVKTYSTKQRILAFFMAFMIFTMTCPEIFEGWGIGLIVHAATPGPNIFFNTDTTANSTTDIKGTTSNKFTYTGNLKTSKVAMFDYVSDEEINGTYNSINHDIPNGGYDDAYTALNFAISNTTSNNDASQNITFVYKTIRSGVTDVNIYLFNDSKKIAWPGYAMTYDGSRDAYVLTMKFTNIKDKDSGNAFVPTKFIINGEDQMTQPRYENGRSDSRLFQTETVSTGAMSAGKKYSYADYQETTGTANEVTFTLKKNYARVLKALDKYDKNVEHTYGNMELINTGGLNWFLVDGDWSGNNYYVRANIWDGSISNSADAQMTASGDSWTCTLSKSSYKSEFYVNFKSQKYGNDGDWHLSNLPNQPQPNTWAETDIYKVRWGYNYTFGEHLDPVGTAENTYSCVYANPLYFGTFYNGPDVINYNEDSEKPGGIANNSSGTAINRPGPYNNFYWRPNISFKQDATNHRGNVSVQGLVDSTLKTYNTGTSAWDFNKTGSLTQTNGSTVLELPYFNTSWADNHSTLMKYYNKNGATGHAGEDIYFPFYEVVTPTTTTDPTNDPVSSSVNHLTGSGAFASGEYARFYQFVAKDTNVHFVASDPTNHKGYFEEKSKKNKISSNLNRKSNGDRNNDNNVGFFPFNDTETKYGKGNNRGFGARYDLSFQLQSDGCVGVTDVNGVDLVNDGTTHTARIHTIFEFTGDDDLWVFVDGKLVLDMGGAHSQSSGIIDFATGTSTVTYKKALGTSTTDKDNLGVDPDTTTPVDITSLITGCTKNNETNKVTYDNTTHTMTIFYMERGMNDSNLLIRYNYSPMSNFSKMKVQEYTDFSNVNKGLLAKTMEAADYDVFEYTVQNKGTAATDPKLSSAVYPTTDTHNRINPGNSSKSTTLTPNGASSPAPAAAKFNPANTTDWLPVTNTTYLWVDAYAGMNSAAKGGTGKGAGKTDGTYGKLYLMYGTDKNTDLGIESKESSAEFEEQFTEKTSYMRVMQGAYLTSPGVPEGETYTSLKVANVRADSEHPNINVSDYYTLSSVKLQSVSQDTPTDLTTDYNNTTTYPNGAEFLFKNAANVDASVNTMLTEYFTNTVKTADLEIKKQVSGPTEQTDFTFEIELSSVFGVSNVNVSNHGNIMSSKNNGSETVNNINGTNKGTFTLKNGETLKIKGIPVYTKYTITETNHPAGATVAGEVTTKTPLTTNKTGDYAVTITNTYQSETGVDVLKKNSSNHGLPGAELELWYKETSTPPTYHFNDPQVVPYKMNGMKISKSPSEIGIPGLEEVRSSYTVYTEKTSYSNPDVPSSKDTDCDVV